MKTEAARKHRFIISAVGAFYVAVLGACSSGDDVTVTTESNASADNGSAGGAAITRTANARLGSLHAIE